MPADDRFHEHDPDRQRALRTLAALLEEHLPDGMGFGVLMFDMGGDGSMYWISNAERPGMVRAMREWIAKNETADRAHRGRICPQCHGVGTLQR